MENLQSLSDFNAIKILSDPRRLTILRALMADEATLTHLGQAMDMHPAKARYHLKLLEEVGLVQLVRTQVVENYTEKYYRATSKAFSIQVSVLPKGAGKNAIIASGSNDLALDLMANTFSQDKRTPALFTLPVGSLDGLIALRQGLCHLAGCHLLDPQGGEYNTSYVRHFFPGQTMHIVTMAHRQQGLMVASGNPQDISSLEDVAREDITFINRNPGSGTRMWFDQQLESLEIEPAQIVGYTTEVSTHSQVAKAICSDQADVGVGIFAAAQKFKLEFIPLFEERFDLVIPKDKYESRLLRPALDYLQTGQFRKELAELGGYYSRETGQEIYL